MYTCTLCLSQMYHCTRDFEEGTTYSQQTREGPWGEGHSAGRCMHGIIPALTEIKSCREKIQYMYIHSYNSV